MNSETIQKMIKLAHEIVKNEKEPFNVVAFEIVLQHLLNQDIVYSGNHKEKIKTTIPGIEEKNVEISSASNSENNLKKLANNCEITLEKLKDTISIKNGEIHLLAPIKGKESEKQVIAAQCVLLGLDELSEQEWVKATVLKECLRNNGIRDKSRHLAENLKNKESVFRSRGSNMGTEYKLTSSGKIEAYKLIKQLSTGE